MGYPLEAVMKWFDKAPVSLRRYLAHTFRVCATTAIVLILYAEFACAGQTMTLAQCLKKGMEDNPSLKASQHSLVSAGYDIKAARADFLPSVSSSYSASTLLSERSQGPTDTDYLDQDIHAFSLKLSQILYAGSRIVNTYGKAKVIEQAAKAEMDLKQLELSYQIETTFYKLMKAREDMITATESIARLTESVKAAEAFFQKELVAYVEVLQARVDLADAKEQLGIAKNNVERERVVLFSLMNLPLDPSVEFSGGLYQMLKEKPLFESCLKDALENRPDIKSLLHQLDVANIEAKIAMGKYLPMVRFEVGYYDQDRDYDSLGESSSGPYDRDQRNQYWSTGIYVTWNFFDGGRSWYEKKKYNTEAEKIKALISDASNTIATGIQRALYSLSEAEQRIANSAEALIAANEYYAMEENRLRAGISTIPALLDAQTRLIRAQSNKTRALLDYQLAKSELKLMTGDKNRQDG